MRKKLISISALIWILLIICSCSSSGTCKCQNDSEKIQQNLKEEKSIDFVEVKEKQNLIFYYPNFSRIELICEEMPNKDNKEIIMVCAAAYTVKKIPNFEHSNIIGDHISKGKRYQGSPSKSYRGAFTFYNNQPHFAYNDWSKDFNEAQMQDGCGFAQDMMIHNGKIVKYARNPKDSTEFRALCLDKQKLAIADSKGKMRFDEFVDLLLKSGVQEAIYLDMGDWKHSWYRNNLGQITEIYPNPTKFGTNWITFYK